MASNVPLPTLSADGWVYNTQKKADYLLGHFLVSEKSQDPFFTEVTSFPWLIATYGDSEIDLATNTEEALKNYLSVYYTTAKVSCTVETIDGNPNLLRLIIRASIIDADGTTFDMNNVLKVENSKVVDIARQNNGTLPITDLN